TVVGVMPPAFDFPDAATALWIPFGMTPDESGPREARWVEAVARLRPGGSLASAQEELRTIAARLAGAYPATHRDDRGLAEPRLRAVPGDVRELLLVAWAMVALVLVIVTTNVANLFLARASAREGEVAVRTALGARRGALLRLFLVESLTLALAGGLSGC